MALRDPQHHHGRAGRRRLVRADARGPGRPGIEPDDDPAACRWAALRNQARGLDIVATVIRQDGRWARLHGDTAFARSACAYFAHDHGLHPSA
ncbi:hypothetical protein AB0399_35680 [Streptomyces sp. NPDC088194]|uniref:hypothetical protein n=1 Tax=Streptomyces sp. NPDC088194 TaxID=3154931 RepID=UPI00344BEB91